MLTSAIWKKWKSPGPTDAGIAEGNDADGDQRATQGDDGSQEVERAIDAGGDDVFFEKGLCAVDERLQQTEGTDAVGAPAILNAANKLALKQHGVGDGHQQYHRHHDDLEQAPQEKLPKSSRVLQPLLLLVKSSVGCRFSCQLRVPDAAADPEPGAVAAQRAGGEEAIVRGLHEIAALV